MKHRHKLLMGWLNRMLVEIIYRPSDEAHMGGVPTKVVRHRHFWAYLLEVIGCTGQSLTLSVCKSLRALRCCANLWTCEGATDRNCALDAGLLDTSWVLL